MAMHFTAPAKRLEIVLASLTKVLHLLVRGSTRARCRTHVADNATQQSKCMKDCKLDSARLLAWTVQATSSHAFFEA